MKFIDAGQSVTLSLNYEEAELLLVFLIDGQNSGSRYQCVEDLKEILDEYTNT